MDSLYSLCVIFCFATTVALALTESRDAKWRVHMEERMEEMLQMIQRQNKVIEKQAYTIEEQMKIIEKQELEINYLQDRVVKLERRSDSRKQKSSPEIFTEASTSNGTILSTIEKDHLHNEGKTYILFSKNIKVQWHFCKLVLYSLFCLYHYWLT